MKLLGVPGRLDLYGGGDYGLDLRGFGRTADSNQVVDRRRRAHQRGRPGRHAPGRHPDRHDRAHRGDSRQQRPCCTAKAPPAGAIVITTKAAAGKAREQRPCVPGAWAALGAAEARAGATLVSRRLLARRRRPTSARATGYRDNFRSAIEGLAHDGPVAQRLAARRRAARAGRASHRPAGRVDDAASTRPNPRQTTHPTTRPTSTTTATPCSAKRRSATGRSPLTPASATRRC